MNPRKKASVVTLLFFAALLFVGSLANPVEPQPEPTTTTISTTTTTTVAYPEHVKAALTDAVHRFGVPMERITVVAVEEVIWRSTALGCPKPDAYYAQVLVEGYLIILTVDGKEVRYHGQVDREPFYCQPGIVLLAP